MQVVVRGRENGRRELCECGGTLLRWVWAQNQRFEESRARER